MTENIKKSFEKMLKDGNYAEAESLLKNAMELEPGNWEAKMLYGTCRLLQGDTEAAKRIHDELEPHFSADLDLPEAERTFWQKYHNWIIYGTAATLVAVLGAAVYFGESISAVLYSLRSPDKSPGESWRGLNLYAAPKYYRYRSPDHAPARNNRPENE